MSYKAKKSYGQHFLINENLANKIAETAIDLNNKYPILEVGPGQGVLTKYLIKENSRFMAVEADIEMVEYLHNKFPGIELNLIYKDFLKLEMENIFPEEEFIIFGNFPYNISTQIVFKMLENHNRIPVLIGMFQKEVAERIIAPAGKKDYGILSVLTQAYYTGNILFRLKPGSFNPPPKVDSAVIILERKENTNLGCNEKLFKSIIKITFNQRRKMIRNTLKGMILDTNILNDDFFNLRPEQLKLEDFINLTNIIEKQKH